MYIEPRKESLPFTYKPIQATPTYKYCQPEEIPDFAPNYPPEKFAPLFCYGIIPDWYYISTYGRIYSAISKRFLFPCNSKGYRIITLTLMDHSQRRFGVHRLVAATFIPMTIDDIRHRRNYVNHKNLIRNDNYVWNLEWVNLKENSQHASANKAYTINRNLPENVLRNPEYFSGKHDIRKMYRTQEYIPFKYIPAIAKPNYDIYRPDDVPDKYPEEKFAPVLCFDVMPGFYYVSTYGRVYSMISNKFLIPIEVKNGYNYVNLKMKGFKTKIFKIANLVAAMFLPLSDDDIINHKKYVFHKNLIKTDDYIWNLKWSNIFKLHSEVNYKKINNPDIDIDEYKVLKRYAINKNTDKIERTDINKHKKKVRDGYAFGEDSIRVRLTNDQVRKICEGLEEKKSYSDCCKLAKIEDNSRNRNIICNIAAGRRWQWLSKEYNIPKDLVSGLTDYSQYIIPVCKLLVKHMRTVDIIKELQIPGNYDKVRMFISGIKNKKNYREISDQYF